MQDILCSSWESYQERSFRDPETYIRASILLNKISYHLHLLPVKCVVGKDCWVTTLMLQVGSYKPQLESRQSRLKTVSQDSSQSVKTQTKSVKGQVKSVKTQVSQNSTQVGQNSTQVSQNSTQVRYFFADGPSICDGSMVASPSYQPQELGITKTHMEAVMCTYKKFLTKNRSTLLDH